MKTDTMKKENIKNKILEYVKRHPGTSFAEIEQFIPEFKGETEIAIKESNIILWGGVSIEGAQAIYELKEEGKIEAVPCNILVYLYDGYFLDIPIAKRARKYKEPHWLPVVLNTAKE